MGVGKLDDLRELIDDYWCLAFAEGRDGRTTDTPDGDAQKCISAIEAIIREARNALTPPEGFVLVPAEPTEEMLEAGRAAVMAEHCAGIKWTPRQHFEASGRSTAGIPEDVLDERGPLTKESTAVMVFGSMLAARPEVGQ